MRSQRTALAALACAIFLLSLLGEERAFAQVQISWNQYRVVEEVYTSFQSIAPQTTPISNSSTTSSNAAFSSGFFPIQLPFYFSSFLGITSDKLWVSINGAATLGPSDPSALPLPLSYDLSFVSASSSSAQKLMMPFWGNFTTVNSGGIYTRTELLPSGHPLGSRVQIVEWHVYEPRPPGGLFGPIVFQLRLYEGTNIIEFIYGTSGQQLLQPSPSGTSTGSYGAVVGIKNTGQHAPCGPTQYDAALSLIISNQTVGPLDVHVRQPNYCITGGSGCGTCAGGTKWAELTSIIPPHTGNSNASYSNSFHYIVPTVGYRIKPVIVDVGGDTNGVGSRVCQIYNGGDTVSFTAPFRNYGTDAAQKLPVVAQLLRRVSDQPEAIMIEVRDTIPSIGPGKEILHRFSKSFILPAKPAEGTYRVKLWCSLPGDWNRLNDTVTYRLNIGGRNDAMACCITSPRLNITGPPARYSVNTPISIDAGFFNAGANSLPAVPVRARIVDSAGTVLYNSHNAGTDTSLTQMSPGEERGVHFGYWPPAQPGLYYMIASTHLSGDDVPWNNELYSSPYATPGRRSLTPLPRIPFIVAYAVDLALLTNMGAGPISITPGGLVPVSVTLSNNGAYDQRKVAVQAQIVQRGTGRKVYTKSMTVALIEAGAQQTIYFPTAVIALPGTYDLKISITPKDDAIKTDNSVVTAINCARGRISTQGSSGSPNHQPSHGTSSSGTSR